MASVSKPRRGKDGTLTWYVYFRLDGTQTSQPFADEHQALSFRDEINATAPYRGGPTNPAAVLKRHGIATERIGGPTIEEWVSCCITKGKQRDKTKVKYRQILANDIAPAFKGVRLLKLSFVDIEGWITAMTEDGASTKTIRNKYTVLNFALNEAVKRGRISAHPCAQEDDFLPSVMPSKKRILKLDEFHRLRDAFLTDEMRLFVQFLIVSGCRVSEATALQPDDVDHIDATAYIHQAWEWLPPAARSKKMPGPYFLKDHPKTPTSTREIHITHQMVTRLKDAGMLDPARDFVFLNEDGGPIRQYTFKNKWAAAVKRSGLKGRAPTIKDLRATFASWEIAAKVDPLVVQNHMGHANVSTTLTWYAEMDKEESRAAADERGKRLFGSAS
jgi:integrase